MQESEEFTNRRVHERLSMHLRVWGERDGAALRGRSEDVSIGGARIRWRDGQDPQVGETIAVRVDLPGGAAPLETRAEVRWRGGQGMCGVAFDKRAQGVLAAFFAGICGLSSITANAATSVPTFDEHADVVIQDTGSERPDEHTIELAFKKQNDALDKCVEGTGATVKGKAKVTVLLNPEGHRPLGINTKLPQALQNNADFRECVRGATAAAPFPAYDGPPVVVDLDFQIDAGSEYEEDW